MNRQAKVLVNILEKHAQSSAPVDIFPLVTHCALDIICETAMGRCINAQANSDTEYVRAIYAGSDIVFKRQASPWLWSDWFFYITPLGWRWRKALGVLHGFTNSVIRERKAEIAAEESANLTDKEQDDVGIKKRMAFLDLLIKAMLRFFVFIVSILVSTFGRGFVNLMLCIQTTKSQNRSEPIKNIIISNIQTFFSWIR
jgi:hypothetical protein